MPHSFLTLRSFELGGDRGEGRPPNGVPRHRPAIPVAITQRARRLLEHGISDHIGAEHPAPLIGRDRQFLLDRRASDRDRHPIEEGDDRQDREDADNGMALLHHLTSPARSEEHTSELQSLIRISFSFFFLNHYNSYLIFFHYLHLLFFF